MAQIVFAQGLGIGMVMTHRGRVLIRSLPSLLILAVIGCSDAEPLPQPSAAAGQGRSHAVAIRPVASGVPSPAASGVPKGSRVIGKHDRGLDDGRPVCVVDFVYARREPEDLFWEEPCAAITARMVDRRELVALDRWERLDAFQRGFVTAMPGGKVLYVEGAFSASIYPVDTTGTSIEVSVAD